MFLLLISVTSMLLLLLPHFVIAQIDEEEAQPLLEETEQQQKRAGGRAFNFEEKRGGAHAFNFAPDEKKRAGGRAFSHLDEGTQQTKRGGARAFHGSDDELISELKRAGGRVFQLDDAIGADNFAPDERKRGGARPFYGGGYMDGAWKRAGGRYFMRHFDDGPFGGWAVKRGGGHRFTSKRGGGRSFFGGGVDSLFDNANYWAPQRFIAKYRRASPMETTEQRAVSSAPYFFANRHAWEKRAGGRNFNGAE